MSTPLNGPNLVARLTTTFSRQRCRTSISRLPLVRSRSTARSTEAPKTVDTSFYEDGFTVPEPSVSFLEPDGEEYHRVVLPPRERRVYTPPWPTILAHPPAMDSTSRLPEIETGHPHAPVTYLKRSTFSQDNPTPCQALHHLIRVEKDYVAARQMMAEFKDLGIPIQPHRAYLDAAIHQARRRGQHAAIKQDVLDWLGYWHSFHPVKQFRHGPIVALEPLVELVLERWAADTAFLEHVLVLAAERGWVPALMPVLFKHYTMCTDPSTSYALLNELAAAYASKPPRIEDETPGAEERRAASVVAQVQKWRNGHMRTIVQCGHVEEARMIYQAGEAAGVLWDVATKNALIHALQSDNTPTTRPAVEEQPVLSLKRQALRVAHRRSRQPVRHLVETLTTLETLGRTRLISRLSTRFLGRRVAGNFVRGSTNETTASYWWMAHVVKARNEGRHADALELFRDKFYAVGLPQNVASSGRRRTAADRRKRSVRDRKLYPSPEVISAVMPSVIKLAEPATSDALVALHAEFLRSASMFSTLKTDPLFHLAFISYHAHTFGAAAAERFCERLEKNGVTVGVQGWSVVAVEYAKSRKMKDIHGIIDRMSASSSAEAESSPSPSLPTPTQANERTFIGVASALLKRKKYYKAKAILERWHEEQERRGLVVRAQEM